MPMRFNLIPRNGPRPEFLENAMPYPVFMLRQVYLEAGLPPEAALRSALADYEQSFSSWELKLI